MIQAPFINTVFIYSIDDVLRVIKRPDARLLKMAEFAENLISGACQATAGSLISIWVMYIPAWAIMAISLSTLNR